MIQFMKKGIEKEAEVREKLVLNINNIRKNNGRLKSSNQSNGVTIAKLDNEVKTKQGEQSQIQEVLFKWKASVADIKKRLEFLQENLELQINRRVSAEKCIQSIFSLVQEVGTEDLFCKVKEMIKAQGLNLKTK